MTQTAAIEVPEQAAPTGTGREVFVHGAMLLLVIAVGFALRINLGFGVPFSILIAVGAYWALLLMHVSVRRGCAIAELGASLDRLDAENAELKRVVGAARAMAPPPAGAWPGGPRVPMAQAMAQQGGAHRPAPPPRPTPPMAGAAPPAARAQARAPTAPAGAPAAGQVRTIAADATGPARAAEAAPRSGPPSSGPPSLPSAPPQRAAPPVATGPTPPPVVQTASPGGKPATKTDDGRELATPSDAGPVKKPREEEIAAMQSLIRDLAEQINGAVPAVGRERAADAGAPPVDGDAAEALREAAEAMRASLGDHRRGEPQAEAAHHPDYGRLARVAAAIEAQRIDLYLEPILGLDDRRARHFEVSVRVRGDDGRSLEEADVAQDIAGTGLQPRIDAEKITRSARLAHQLRGKGSSAALFAGVASESIADGEFQGRVGAAVKPHAGRLVMAIAQTEIRGFAPAHWDALASMAQNGLRFALVDVVDLDLDFEALKSRGFDFVRLDASVFLEGLPAPHGFVPAADLCRHLSGLGFGLIVGRIADEMTVAKIHGFGAVLGQGVLFGGPRPVQLDMAAA